MKKTSKVVSAAQKCTFDSRLRQNFCHATFCNNDKKKCGCRYPNGSIRYSKSLELRIADYAN